MVTGRPPFVEGDVLYHHIHTPATSPRERNPRVPVWLDAIILKAMVKEPSGRFPSVAALLQELDRSVSGARGTGPPSANVPR
jgi:serine/threonine protein kinase